MIEIPLRGPGYGTIRIADSPLWETLGSVVLLSSPRQPVPWPYTDWARAARRAPRAVR